MSTSVFLSSSYIDAHLLHSSYKFPNKQTTGCSTYSPSDTANFLAFLQELRQGPVIAKLMMSAAVAMAPFLNEDGVTPIKDVKAFADALDFIGEPQQVKGTVSDRE